MYNERSRASEIEIIVVELQIIVVEEIQGKKFYTKGGKIRTSKTQ